ncbi:hypothetical protein EVAR_96564_1 [Eumeta japonica]|uniref:Uncharacterized protein n=1 Tax=Eumeta variegata TaxID=151549 RepID=A0A4C1WQW4_EUMVA|nr:hypothetical protein EVAR_96564_1 [Eumeta japonica]
MEIDRRVARVRASHAALGKPTAFRLNTYVLSHAANRVGVVSPGRATNECRGCARAGMIMQNYAPSVPCPSSRTPSLAAQLGHPNRSTRTRRGRKHAIGPPPPTAITTAAANEPRKLPPVTPTHN